MQVSKQNWYCNAILTKTHSKTIFLTCFVVARILLIVIFVCQLVAEIGFCRSKNYFLLWLFFSIQWQKLNNPVL